MIAYNTKPKKRCNNGEIFHFPKELKQRIDCLQWKAKTLLKQQFDFLFEKRIETTDTLPAIEAKKLLKQRFDFPFEKKN